MVRFDLSHRHAYWKTTKLPNPIPIAPALSQDGAMTMCQCRYMSSDVQLHRRWRSCPVYLHTRLSREVCVAHRPRQNVLMVGDNGCTLSAHPFMYLHTYLSIDMLLNMVGMLFTCPVSHEHVTVTHLWLVLMTKPVYFVIQPGPITKSTQVCVCVCVFVRPGLGAYIWHAIVVRSYWIWSVCFVCVQFKWRQLTWCLGRMSKAYRDRKWINACWGKALWWSLTVSQNLSVSL